MLLAGNWNVVFPCFQVQNLQTVFGCDRVETSHGEHLAHAFTDLVAFGNRMVHQGGRVSIRLTFFQQHWVLRMLDLFWPSLAAIRSSGAARISQ